MSDKHISWKNILDEVETLNVEGVQIEFLKPRGEFTPEDSSKPYPLVWKLAFKNTGFLFGEGIMEENVLAELNETYKDRIRSRVLYVPKFFEREKNITDFVKTVSPRVIVTNSGFQNSNKPHRPRGTNDYDKETLDVFQTDTQGTITVLTDGKEIRVKTFLDNDRELVY
jgi:competence protein ComEC